ncbi:MAG: alpha/beta hydrolase [Silicimonas sp.]|jgi:phospholipase/carboxylesterase|nr:alpha/beta hydrolase [Silicimonas sp.]
MSYHAARTDGAPGAPLVFTFHGTGGDETQFHGIAAELLPDAHVVSPRGDVSEMGANRYFRRTGEGVYDMDDLWSRAAAMADFMAAEKARTGAERVLALGYSNGANILAAVAMIRPDIVDDMALMHPLIPWAPEPQAGLAGRRVLITAGERDPICPAPLTRALDAYLRDQKAQVETVWHPGGHEIRREELAALQDFFRTDLIRG